LLENNDISFLDVEQQADLLARVIQAQQEVVAAQSLFRVTEGQIGIEAAALAPWHQLVSECWQVASRFRLEQSASIQAQDWNKI
jgi:hypothetical protein